MVVPLMHQFPGIISEPDAAGTGVGFGDGGRRGRSGASAASSGGRTDDVRGLQRWWAVRMRARGVAEKLEADAVFWLLVAFRAGPPPYATTQA